MRVDKVLMKKFKIVVAEHNRSINGEIVMLIKQAVADYEKEFGAIQLPEDGEEE